MKYGVQMFGSHKIFNADPKGYIESVAKMGYKQLEPCMVLAGDALPFAWNWGNIEEYVQLPTAIFGKGDFFLLRASGDSMIEAGIDDGDLVLVRHQDHADPGQIVVALIGEDEATLKRFYPEPSKGIIRLHPENQVLDDIIVENCSIQGVAVHVVKALA